MMVSHRIILTFSYIKKLFLKLSEFGQKQVSFKHLSILILFLMFAPSVLTLINQYTIRWNVETITEDEKKRYGIKRIINQVQDELLESEIERRMEHKDGLFTVKSLELEITFVVSAGTSQSGELGLKLITVDSESDYSQEQIQTIKLQMVATQPEEQKILFNGSVVSPATDQFISLDPAPPIKLVTEEVRQ